MAWPGAWRHVSAAQALVFGPGEVRRLGELVREVGARRILLVCSPGRLASDEGQVVVDALGRTLAATAAEARPGVPTGAVQATLALVRSAGVDAVVSLGGGAAIDLAKAVAFFVEQQAGTPGATHLDRPALPHLAVPTTYVGAECSSTFAVTEERSRTTSPAGAPTLAPVTVVYDPSLTLDLSPSVSAATAGAAMANAVEAVCATVRSPEAEVVALAAITGIARALPAVVDEPGEPEPRADLLTASALAGRAMAQAQLGAQHALAQLLAGRTGLAHGLAHSVLLPHTMRFNAEFAEEAMAKVGLALGDPDDAAGAVARLFERVGLPIGLLALDVAPEELDAVARLSQGHRGVQRNVRPVGELDARAILEDAS